MKNSKRRLRELEELRDRIRYYLEEQIVHAPDGWLMGRLAHGHYFLEHIEGDIKGLIGPEKAR